MQTIPPFQYRGYVMDKKGIKPQKVQIRQKKNLNTLSYFQKLLGDINWI
jgi:hypothetical protein